MHTFDIKNYLTMGNEDNEPIDFEKIKRDMEEAEVKNKEIHDRMIRREDQGMVDIIKYFDRIHDHLFSYNNLLIGAFFALAQFQKGIPAWTIFFPLANLWILLSIEYRMMNKSRYESDIMNQPFDTYDKHSKNIDNTNRFSLFSIMSTFTVTIVFLYYLLG